jgi:microcin C transport system substrate-binding protein
MKDQSLRILFRGLSASFCGIFLALLVGCGGGEEEDAEVFDNEDAVKAHYASLPDFYRFQTPADIPADLTWEDGMDLPDLGSPEAKKGGVLRGWIQDFPRTFRFIGPDSNGSFRPYILDYNLMQYAHRHPNETDVREGGFHYFPGVAEKWALDYENKRVYVKINPAARWSDGNPVTTADATFAFYLYQSEYHKQIWYNDWYKPNGYYSDITVYDDHTFSIGLVEKRPNMLNLVMDLTPLPREFFREYGEDYIDRYQWRVPPTTGAYVVRDRDVRKGRSISLTRQEDWWAKDLKFWRNRFNYDQVRLDVIREASKAFESFQKGDLDMFGLTLPLYWYDRMPDDHPLVQQGYVQKIKFFNDKPRPTYGLWMNSSRPLLDNRDIRVGINFASNWQLVCDQYFRGDAIRMRTSADGYGTFTHPDLEPRPFDPDKALEAFARAGFTQRGPDGILVNEAGQRLSVELTTGYESLKDVLTILKEEARKAGLEFRVEVLDGTAAWKKVQEKKHDIMFSAFNVSPEMFPRYKETYHSERAYDQPWLEDGSVNPDRKPKTQTNNLQVIAYPELDAMIEAYDSSDSVEEMIDLAYKMEELIYEDASFCPGFVLPFYRFGAWRWVQFPDDVGVKITDEAREYRLGWIDLELKAEVEKAMASGETFEPVIKVVDKYAPEGVDSN